MAAKLTQLEKEDLRLAVREQMVAAQTVALTAEMLHARVKRSRMLDFDFTAADVEAAAELLVGLGHAGAVPHSLGATKYYQATAAGVLAHERGQ